MFDLSREASLKDFKEASLVTSKTCSNLLGLYCHEKYNILNEEHNRKQDWRDTLIERLRLENADYAFL